MLDTVTQKKKQTIVIILSDKSGHQSALPAIARLHLTLRQLEVFVATARTGSTRAAADRVARSQSAASAALAELEAALGAPLFDRVGRRLVLNESGRTLLPKAASLLDQAADVQHLFSGAHAAPLRLAASLSIGEYLLPGLLAQWKRGHRANPVRLLIGNTREVIAAVAAFEADVGFVEGSVTHPQLTVRAWMSDELVVVAAADHPLAGRPASLRQLREAPWALREPGSGTREAADRWLLERVGPLQVDFELSSPEGIKRLVAAGAALGCLAREVVAHELALGTLVELETGLPRATRRLGMVLHRDRQLGRDTEDFLQHCHRFAHAGRESGSATPARAEQPDTGKGRRSKVQAARL
jgi:DNA-binding transcriptional LysR family regulator